MAQGRTAPTRRDELVFSAKVTTPRGHQLDLRQRVDGGVLRIGESSIELAAMEFGLLQLLVERRRTVTDPELAYVAWHEIADALSFRSVQADSENVRELVHRVRRKLGERAGRRLDREQARRRLSARRRTRVKHAIAVVALAATLSGCATLFAGGPDTIPINTNPPGAYVYLNGQVVGQTPMVAHPRSPALSSGDIRIYYPGFQAGPDASLQALNGWFFVQLASSWPGFIVDLITGDWQSFDDEPIIDRPHARSGACRRTACSLRCRSAPPQSCSSVRRCSRSRSRRATRRV